MAHLFVISAPSGAGKTSLIHAILNDEMSEKTKLGISCTTRKIRDDE
ncbi:MAG TPA: guanylate kinase, partial [SAR86 cluster bacterium]|nr:guanylate kinase [SAR86 cluster bacterium]